MDFTLLLWAVANGVMIGSIYGLIILKKPGQYAPVFYFACFCQ